MALLTATPAALLSATAFPLCGGLNEKRPPQTHTCEHLAPEHGAVRKVMEYLGCSVHCGQALTFYTLAPLLVPVLWSPCGLTVISVS